MEASKLEWSNQRQEDQLKFLPGNTLTYMDTIGILLRYNTMKCQLQSLSGTLLGTCRKMSATVQNTSYLPSINVRYQYLEVYRYMTYSRYT